MSRHLFVDEIKDRDYLLAASAHASGDLDDLDDLRTLMRGLVLKGQRRVHMKKESDPRKRAIAAAICGAGVTATIYDAGRRYRRELDARAACLHGLITDAADQDDTLLVLEQDDSLIDWDRRQLYTLTREAHLDRLRYEHRRASTEQTPGHPRRDRLVLGQRRTLAPPHRTRRHHRPAGINTPRAARSPAHQPSGWLPGSLPSNYCCRHRQV